MKRLIADALKNVLHEMGVDDVDPHIEAPTDMQFGDYTTNVALIAAKKLGKSPREVAEAIASTINSQQSTINFLEKTEVAGPGFVNFWVAREELVSKLHVISIRLAGEISHEGHSGGGDFSASPRNDKIVSAIGNGKKVIVEYSSPNIAKPFTIGHLRSTIIGDAVANLLDAVGYDVVRDNHVGDWGTQFGKQIYAIKTWGDEEKIETSERPVKELVDLYVKFHDEAEKDPSLEDEARDWFKKLEDGDTEARRLWQKCIDWSWKEFEGIYKQLGVRFSENNGRGYGESFFEDKMVDVIKELEEKGLLKEGKEGARIVEFDEVTKLPPLMILKKDGATLYATRDLATDKFRIEKYGKDVTIINEVGAEQELYFRQLIELEQMLGWIKPGQKVHIKHGLYRFKEGKMSTRKGNVIWLEDVLKEAEERAKVLGKETTLRQAQGNKGQSDGGTEGIKEDNQLARVVSIGAIKWNDLKRDSKQDITFDWDDILNMEGNSGPYIQYTYARTQSVLRKGGRGKGEGESFEEKVPFTLNASPLTLEVEEEKLLRMLYKFEDVVVSAAERYSPNILASYLFELAQQFNLFYQKHSILNPVISNEERNPHHVTEGAGDLSSPASRDRRDDTIRQFRLALTAATGNVIKSGLDLLGIQAPERM